MATSEEPTLSFTVTEDNTKFRCFASGCDASGMVLILLPDSKASTRFVMQPSWSKSDSCEERPRLGKPSDRRAPRLRYPWLPSLGAWAAKSQRASGEGEHGNQPLSWQHEKLDYEHPYLLKTRGFSRDILREFGVGYYPRKGMMHGRVVFPIHIEGQLIAYVGRWAEDPVPSGKRKYFLPPRLRRGLELYNLHRAIKEALRRSSSKVTSMCCDSMRQGISVVGVSWAHRSPMSRLIFSKKILIGCSCSWMGMSREGSQQYQSQRNSSMIFVRIVTLPEGIDPDRC